MKTYNIKLMDEETQSLIWFKEICIFEDKERDIKIFISIPKTKRSVLREDILERYDNEEYWNPDIEENPDLFDKENV